MFYPNGCKCSGSMSVQVVKKRHVVALKIMGRIGWGAKAVIYAMIGGLACQNAVGDRGLSASPEVKVLQCTQSLQHKDLPSSWSSEEQAILLQRVLQILKSLDCLLQNDSYVKHSTHGILCWRFYIELQGTCDLKVAR